MSWIVESVAITPALGGVYNSSPPVQFAFLPNYPNPFNPGTTFQYTLSARSHVHLTIYKLQGREIRRLVKNEQAAGAHAVVWDGRNYRGAGLSTGIYLYRLAVEPAGGISSERTYVKVGKMLLLR